jgi:hypothetical protein
VEKQGMKFFHHIDEIFAIEYILTSAFFTKIGNEFHNSLVVLEYSLETVENLRKFNRALP